MNEDEQIERFAKSFRLAGPSESLRQQVLESAHATWLIHAETRAHSKSLTPYFAVLAATLLIILTVNAVGNHTLEARQSGYVVTVRPGRLHQLNEEMGALLPNQPGMALCIVNVSDAKHQTYFSQLQTLLSQGASL